MGRFPSIKQIFVYKLRTLKFSLNLITMKIKLLATFMISLFFSQMGNAMLNNDQISDDAWSKSFKRTFKNGKKLVYKNGFKKTTLNNKLFKKNTDDISITFSDFSSHLLPGLTRTAIQLVDSYTMDIGQNNSGVKETWVFADPQTTNMQTVTLDQMEAEGTAIEDSFGQGTHVMYSKEHDFYELFDLQDDVDLLFVGSTVEENGFVTQNDYYQSRSPVPLELGLTFSSVVDFEDEDNTGYKIEYTDTYEVVGQGTLKTYDDGDAEALKMIYKEETREYQNDVETSYSVRYEVIFYSKKGHYIIGDIPNPNVEGEVVLEGLKYQKIAQKTASVIEENNVFTKLFPNPVKANEVLHFESKISLQNHTVDLFNILGKKINTLSLSERNNNKYESTISANIANGLYFYNIKNKEGVVVANGKVQIK